MSIDYLPEGDMVVQDTEPLSGAQLEELGFSRAKMAGLTALYGAGSVLFMVGQFRNNLPEAVNTVHTMGVNPVDSTRHVLMGLGLTSSAGYLVANTEQPPSGNVVVRQFRRAFASLVSAKQKAAALAIGFAPSVGYEAWQRQNGHPFSFADLAVAGGAGVITVLLSSPDSEIVCGQPQTNKSNS